MIDIVLSERYPRTIELEDGTKLTVRPMARRDKRPLLEFFSRLPRSERVFLQHDVTDPKVIDQWCRNLNYMKVLPLLALDGKSVVANAALRQYRTGWRSHIGRVRVVVDPAYRRRGLANTLLGELIHVAINTGLAKLEAEFMKDQKAAIEAFQKFGFVEVATIPEHVWDQNGVPRDYVLMVYDMRDREYFAGD